jgi:DNA mismatch repair ATPase MutS
MELLQLPLIYPTAKNFHMAVEGGGDDMIFLHKTTKGPCQIQSYGLYAAERMGFPRDVLEVAKGLHELLSNSSGKVANVVPSDTAQLQVNSVLQAFLITVHSNEWYSSPVFANEENLTVAPAQAIYELGQRLTDLGSSTLDDESLRKMLLELKARFFVTPKKGNGRTRVD